jgi:hypothetical protein
MSSVTGTKFEKYLEDLSGNLTEKKLTIYDTLGGLVA